MNSIKFLSIQIDDTDLVSIYLYLYILVDILVMYMGLFFRAKHILFSTAKENG